MRLGMFLMCVMLTLPVVAADKRTGWQAGQTLPQDRPLSVTLQALDEQREDIYSAGVLVNVGLKNENPTWGLTQTVLPVMLQKLLELPQEVAGTNDVLTMKAPYSEPAYKGLELRLKRVDGKAFEMLRVYNGAVRTAKGTLVAKDPGRRFEYWLWGTARVKREVVMGARIMPVLTFEQCRLMGQDVVDSLPRQCLLPDGDMLLDVKEPLTMASLKATDFDGCLRHGVGIINSFPRRCVVPGGRVFVEPPRVLETPADAPLAEGMSTGLPVNVTPTVVPVSTTVIVPGVGNFNVSSTAELVGQVLGTAATAVTVSATDGFGGSPTVAVSGSMPVTATLVVPGASVSVVVTGTMVVSGAVPLASASEVLTPDVEVPGTVKATPPASTVKQSLSDVSFGH